MEIVEWEKKDNGKRWKGDFSHREKIIKPI